MNIRDIRSLFSPISGAIDKVSDTGLNLGVRRFDQRRQRAQQLEDFKNDTRKRIGLADTEALRADAQAVLDDPDIDEGTRNLIQLSLGNAEEDDLGIPRYRTPAGEDLAPHLSALRSRQNAARTTKERADTEALATSEAEAAAEQENYQRTGDNLGTLKDIFGELITPEDKRKLLPALNALLQKRGLDPLPDDIAFDDPEQIARIHKTFNDDHDSKSRTKKFEALLKKIDSKRQSAHEGASGEDLDDQQIEKLNKLARRYGSVAYNALNDEDNIDLDRLERILSNEDAVQEAATVTQTLLSRGADPQKIKAMIEEHGLDPEDVAYWAMLSNQKIQ